MITLNVHVDTGVAQRKITAKGATLTQAFAAIPMTAAAQGLGLSNYGSPVTYRVEIDR